MDSKTKKRWRKFWEYCIEYDIPKDLLSRWYDSGYLPSWTAVKFHAACREARSITELVTVGFGGARGGGKSHASLAQVGLDDCQEVPGLKVLFLRNLGTSAKESFEDLVPRVFHSTPHRYVSTRGELSFPNGSRVKLGGFKDEKDIDKYIGIEYDVIVIEEATLISKTKRIKLQGSLRSSKRGWKPYIIFTTNPGGVGHAWFKEQLITPHRLGQEKTTRFIPSLAIDNPHINESYHSYLESIPGWLGRAWREGDWDIASGQYFVTFNYDKHVVEFKEQPHWDYWLSMDYGYVHPNVVHLFGKDGDGNVYVIDELSHKRHTPDLIAPDIQAMLRSHRIGLDRIETFVAGGDVFQERTGMATVDKQYAEFGFELTRANMSRVPGALEIALRLGDPAGVEHKRPQSVFIHPRCKALAECLPGLVHDEKRPEDVLKVDYDEDTESQGDDPYDSFRYGIMVAQGLSDAPLIRSHSLRG